MPLVPRRQFGQEAAHGEGEGVAEQGLHLLEKAVAQEEPGDVSLLLLLGEGFLFDRNRTQNRCSSKRGAAV